MAKISDSVCLNHPDTPAVTRCAACGRPVCAKCVVSNGGSDYCSENCAANARSAMGRVDGVMESKKRSDARSRLRTIIILVILAAAAAGGYFYYRNHKRDIDRSLQKTLRETESTISREAGKAKTSVDNGMPGDSNYKKKREGLVK